MSAFETKSLQGAGDEFSIGPHSMSCSPLVGFFDFALVAFLSLPIWEVTAPLILPDLLVISHCLTEVQSPTALVTR